VEHDKQHFERAREYYSLLAGARLTEINFDTLADWLKSLVPHLADNAAKREELALLRQDYEGRIAGMIKALAAVDRSGRSNEHLMAELDSLPHASAQELIACYRRTTAKFRDSFPASYGLAPQLRSPRPRRRT